MKIYQYDTNKYNFAFLLRQHFDCVDLAELHRTHFYWLPKKELSFLEESSTKFHGSFYSKLRSPWVEFIKVYKEFITDEISKQLEFEDFLFQYLPSFRIHLPRQKVIHKTHYDSDVDHRHPEGEINIFLPLTDCLTTNTIWAESKPGKGDYSPMMLKYGEYAIWNGNKCSHSNKDNEEDKCRVSLDFRVLERSKYDEEAALSSVTSGKRFIIGEYYEEL